MTVKRRTETEESRAYWDTVDDLSRRQRVKLIKKAIRSAIDARDALNEKLDRLVELAKRLEI